MPATLGLRTVETPQPGQLGQASCGDCCGCAPAEALMPAVSPVAVALGAVGLFLMPVGLAVAGAWWGRADAVTQLAGGLLGLAVGMGLAWAGGRFISRRKEKTP